MKNSAAHVQDHHRFLTEHYGVEPFVTMLYGSQNYELDSPESDVDTKAMLLPRFGDFALRQKWLSNEHELSSGLCLAKDVRGMFEVFLKSNLNFLECLYTKYHAVNPRYLAYWEQLVTYRNFLANHNPRKLLHAAAGMAKQKFAHLSKPFAGKEAVLAKHGYDPKQLHHLLRLRFFMLQYLRTYDFEACLVPSDSEKDWLFLVKSGELTLHAAQREANFALNGINVLLEHKVNDLPKDPPAAQQAKAALDELVLALLRKHLTYELADGKQLI